jgi:hypothetical protein
MRQDGLSAEFERQDDFYRLKPAGAAMRWRARFKHESSPQTPSPSPSARSRRNTLH